MTFVKRKAQSLSSSVLVTLDNLLITIFIVNVGIDGLCSNTGTLLYGCV